MPFGIVTALSAALQALQPTPAIEPAFLRAEVAVRPPPAFIAFCEAWPAECATSPEREIRADARTLALLAAPNLAVNRTIAPQPDAPGTDVWRLGVAAGDCDDYAVAKRRRLIDHGLPASALRLAVARTDRGERHLVLAVRTDRGDLVLDNLTDAVLPVDRAALAFEMIQRPDKARGWAGVEPTRAGGAAVAVIPAAR
jgi:predicted transglutaminase-like cysteine proteinase